jgi:hypothetical protein
VIKASRAALLGPWVGWAKIKRKATVRGAA